MRPAENPKSNRFVVGMLVGLIVTMGCTFIGLIYTSRGLHARPSAAEVHRALKFQPRGTLDTSGFTSVVENLPSWKPDSTLAEISKIWSGVGYRDIAEIDDTLSKPELEAGDRIMLLITKAMLFNYEGEPERAYEVLVQARAKVEEDDTLAAQGLYTLVYLQGVTALRRGETDNCVMCRGESSCILPIVPAAVSHQSHRFAAGDRSFHRVSRAVPRRPATCAGCSTWPI